MSAAEAAKPELVAGEKRGMGVGYSVALLQCWRRAGPPEVTGRVSEHCWQPVVVLTEKDVVFHCPKSIVLGLGVGTRVSLFPMKTVMGRSTGLQWPIDGLEFAPDGQIGTSNRASAASVTLEMDGTGMLCVVPRAFIQQVVSALLALPERARWPVPAV